MDKRLFSTFRETSISDSGVPPTGVGGPKIYLRLKEPKDTYATSHSRRRIHPPTKSRAFCVVDKISLFETQRQPRDKWDKYRLG